VKYFGIGFTTSTCYLLQDAFVLLDLIGAEETQFSNWFAKTFPLYKHFQNIGMCHVRLNYTAVLSEKHVALLWIV
jgi:hypothetical protein